MKKALFWPLLAVMFWLPLPEGSKPEWAMGILMMLVYGLALFWLLGYALNRLPVTIAFQKARWFHAGFILVACWVTVGMAVTRHPLRRSVLALLVHTAPTSSI